MPRSMARLRRKSLAPPTVSRPALLVQGSDAEFRRLIHDLIAYGHRLDACRDAFAAIAGISGVQYEILMLLSRTPGLAVGEVAARLHRSGAFITIEANKLVARWPGMKRVMLHTPLDWHDPFPVNRGRAVLLAQLEFESREAMEAAFRSPERADAREDFRRFPAFSGSVTHQAMQTHEAWRRPA